MRQRIRPNPIRRYVRRGIRCCAGPAIIALGLLSMQACASRGNAAEPLVLAAASLAPPLDTLVARWTRRTGMTVHVAYGASGTLAQQIRSGVDADVFLSADTSWIEKLTPTVWWPILRNRLVIAVRSEQRTKIASLDDLLNSACARIAIADPQGVPVGRYALAALENAGLYPALRAKLIPQEDARAAANAIRLGAVDAGLVYLTDVAPTADLKVAYEIPDSLHPPIVYGLALLGRRGEREHAAEEFCDYLRTGEAMTVFRQAGFQPLGAADSLPRDGT